MMKQMQKKQSKIMAMMLICAFVLFIIAGMYDELMVTSYSLEFDTLPKAFDGFTIVEVADLHGYSFGAKQHKLVSSILAQKPDLIVLAGDIIDRHDTNTEHVRELLNGIGQVAPIYAVAGNHELDNPLVLEELLALYNEYGVIFLNGHTALIEKDNQHIVISAGIVKINQQGNYWIDNGATPLLNHEFNLCLRHFGNQFDEVSEIYDLVLSGHVHGGVVRIFGIGLLGNQMNLFPKYDKGIFRKGSGSTMVLSAGLGNAGFIRFFNRREIVKITLYSNFTFRSPPNPRWLG